MADPENVMAPSVPAVSHHGGSMATSGGRVAYIMSRFPKLTETFVLFEMLAVEEQGLPVEIYPLLRARNTNNEQAGAGLIKKVWECWAPQRGPQVMHTEAEPLVRRAHFQPFLSWRIMWANLNVICRMPGTYLGTLWTVLRSAWGNFNFVVGGLCIFPKCIYFAHQMDRTGITHIHAHFANHPAVAAFIIHRVTRIPYSFTAHGSDLHRDRRMLREKVAEAEFVVAISHYNRELILQECGQQLRDEVVVLHCGVDTNVFRPGNARIDAQRRRRPYSIFCIGMLHEVKGQTYLLEACRQLRQRGVDFVLNLVGDGPDRAALQRQAVRASLRDQVIFHGRKNRDEIAALLPYAHVVAGPSVPTDNGQREGIPVVLMEAMSSGVAVVASNISGIPELVEDQKSG